MYEWGSTGRFSQKFQDRRLVLKLLMVGHSGTRNLILGMKIGQGCALRVYTSILPKMSILALGPETAYLGISKYQELSFDNENSFRLHIEGLQADFWKTVNLFTWSCYCKFRGHSISGNQKWARKFTRINYWGSTCRLSKTCQLKPLTMKFHIWGFKVSKTQF